MVEDVLNVLGGAAIPRDGVILVIKAVGSTDGALLREKVPGRLSESLLSPAPPSQLAHIGENDTWGVGIGLDCLDEVDDRALVYSTWATDDAVREDTEVLRVLIEEYNDAFLFLEVGGDEYGDIGLGFLGSKGKANLLQTKVFEAAIDGLAEGFCLMLEAYTAMVAVSYRSFLHAGRHCDAHFWSRRT